MALIECTFRVAPKSHIRQSWWLSLFSSLHRCFSASKQQFLSLSLGRPVLEQYCLMLQSQCQERKWITFTEFILNCKKLKDIDSFCTKPHSKLGHPTSLLGQVAEDCVQQLLNISSDGGSTASLSSLSPHLSSLSENFVYKYLNWISAVATCVQRALSFHCLNVPFKPLYTTPDLVFPEMLSFSWEWPSIEIILTRCLDFCLTTSDSSGQKIWPSYLSFQGFSPSTVHFCEYCCSSLFISVSFVHLSVRC